MRVTTEGPLFDGRAQKAMTEIVADVAKEVGTAGQDMVLAGLGATLVNPTGAYEERITLYANAGQARVHDQMAVYGAWLEGVGSRNAPVTRFDGYHNFRNATQQLDGFATEIAERVVRQHIHKLGG